MQYLIALDLGEKLARESRWAGQKWQIPETHPEDWPATTVANFNQMTS